MAEQRNDNFLNELEERTANFTGEDSARFERIMEMRGRAAAPVIAAPLDAAPAQSTNMGIFMRSTMPNLRDQDHLGIFLKRFRTRS